MYFKYNTLKDKSKDVITGDKRKPLGCYSKSPESRVRPGACIVLEGSEGKNRINTHLGCKSQQVLEIEWIWGGQEVTRITSRFLLQIIGPMIVRYEKRRLQGENNVSRQKFHKGLSYSLEEIK